MSLLAKQNALRVRRMKKLLIGITFASLLIGCSDRRDAQIKSLTERLTRLEDSHMSNVVESAEMDLKLWQSLREQTAAHKSQNEINKLLRDYIEASRK